MSSISHILDSFRNLRLEDEDGETLEFSLDPALSEVGLIAHEKVIGVRLPGQFRDLLMYANGMRLFGLDLMSTDQQSYFREHGIISFHNWGNGDFDCVATSSSAYPENAVVFMNHSPEVTVKIEDALTKWIDRAINEIRKHGTLLHPADYRTRCAQGAGIYEMVLAALDGIRCELNS